MAGSPDQDEDVEPMDTNLIGARSMINRSEFIRLLEQALHRLGYPEIAARLEADSVRLPAVRGPQLGRGASSAAGRAPA